jgi:hypothetical protein
MKQILNHKVIERIAKVAIAYNQNKEGYMEFDKKFLSYLDNFDIVVVEETETSIKLKAVIR